jgi:hypothetical protein
MTSRPEIVRDAAVLAVIDGDPGAWERWASTYARCLSRMASSKKREAMQRSDLVQLLRQYRLAVEATVAVGGAPRPPSSGSR